MHKEKWVLERTTGLGNNITLYDCRTDAGYTAAMLVNDLLKADVNVCKVSYEEFADVGMKCVGGECLPQTFINAYDSMRGKGMDGMHYRIFCEYRGDRFEMGLADDKRGDPCGVVTIQIENETRITGDGIIALLKKGTQ